MSHLVKRRRLRPASEVDRNAADVVDVALQTAHSLVNMDLIRKTREIFESRADTFTMAPTDSINAYQPRAMQIVWRDLADRRQTLHVASIINGMDAEFAAMYPGDREFARWALRRRLQPVGLAGQNSEKVDGSKEDPDLGVIKAGLQTVEAVGAIAGARAVFEIPPLGDADPRVGSVADGTDCKVQVMYTRTYNASLVGDTFQRAIAHMIYDPNQWSAAMRGYSTGCNVWLNVAKNQLDNALFVAIVLIEQLVADGKLMAQAGNELDVRDAVGKVDSMRLATLLAQFTKLTPDRGDRALLSSEALNYYSILKVNFARRAFFVPTPSGEINLPDEIGFRFDEDRQQYASPARTSDGRTLLIGTPAADLVQVQQNALKLVVAGFVEAVNEEGESMLNCMFVFANLTLRVLERYVAGVFCSGSSEKGARK